MAAPSMGRVPAAHLSFGHLAAAVFLVAGGHPIARTMGGVMDRKSKAASATRKGSDDAGPKHPATKESFNQLGDGALLKLVRLLARTAAQDSLQAMKDQNQ
jgi:hypothetical protein